MIRIVFIALILGMSFLSAADWTQWRGPTRDGKTSKTAAPWPKSLSNGNLKLIWSVDLAEGYSSPIVAGSKVFTVETKNKKSEIVRAFDRKTGKQIWDNDWAGSMRVPFYAAKNGSWVRSTPATDGKTLFVGGMRDVLVAID
ncbi:PQQ-binding-like beta-propeller repeat protein, partial [Akkermansiaceae bacterium]|nr:PQQ-binding-like beta-propeller repeat protein [Akkermansiaceae bacterium]